MILLGQQASVNGGERAMVMRLEKWFRSGAHLMNICSISESNFKMRILGIGDGPASFNAEATRLGVR